MFSYIQSFYEENILSQKDPRVDNFTFMNSPLPAIWLVGLYLLFVKIVGPEIMKYRKPFEIRKIIAAYNAIQCLFSTVFSVYAMYLYIKTNYNFVCEPQNHRTDFLSLQMVQLSYVFLISRFVEFTDTIFFILRKKFNQASTLHVVHHALVPLISWVGVKLVPGGHYNFAGFINLVVHSVMYLYYMLAALGPNYQKYLWWKKYLTVLQLIQFAIVMTHTINTLVSDCDVPKLFGYMILFQAVLFFILFLQFYLGTFKSKITIKKLIPTINLEKFYVKYKAFFEMCIPNQHDLLADDESASDNENAADNFTTEHQQTKLHSE